MNEQTKRQIMSKHSGLPRFPDNPTATKPRKRFSFWLYPELLEAIKAAARAEEMTASAWVRKAIKARLSMTRTAELIRDNTE